jgi:hypothetical protein
MFRPEAPSRKICITVGLEPSKYITDRPLIEERARIAESAIQIWDGTREDAERITSLFREIAAFRRVVAEC